MRLTHIITSTDTGGAEAMLLKLAAALAPGFDQQVISLLPSGPVADQLRGLGLPVVSLDLVRGVPDPGAVLRLHRALQRFRPTAVHTWMYHATLLGGIVARLAGRPVIWSIHNGSFSAEHSAAGTVRVARLCARLSKQVPARIVSCSERALATHAALGYDLGRSVVIPNGFDLARFRADPLTRAAVRAELGLAAGTMLIGHVARFHAQKDHATFFAAAARMLERRGDVHFLLAGSGMVEANRELGECRRDLQLPPERIHLLGERQDVPRLMAALDVLTLSSAFGEAFPNVLGEAMACGVPCVATDIGDCAYIIGDTGRTVPAGDPEALSAGWEALLALPDPARLALGEAARRRVAEHFEIAAVARRYAAVYAEAADRGEA